MVENMDETHLVYDLDSHVTLEQRGAVKQTYADVVLGSEGFTLILSL